MEDNHAMSIHHQSDGDVATIQKEEHKISLPIAAFSVISVTIGAGMVSVPKSAYNSGIPFAIGYHLFNLISCIYSIHLLIRCGEATGLTSMAQLGYECFGYYSLHLINFVQFLVFGLIPIAYFIIFSDLASSFLLEINWVNENSPNLIGARWFSVLILAVLVFPLVIKKRITELKIAGVLLFASVSLFLILMFILRVFSSNALNINDRNFDGLYRLIFNKQFMSSLSNAFAAYGFQSAFYPIYNSLEKRTYKNGMMFTIFGMAFCFIIYICVMFISLYSFGSDVDGDVLNNLHDINHWEAYILRGIFLLVITTHTPFIFFIGKESLLAVVALVFIPNKKESLLESFEYEEAEKDEHQSKDQNHNKNKLKAMKMTKSQSFKHLNYSKRIICSSVDYNFSLAIPFYNKSIKTLVVPSVYKHAQTVHDMIPNWLYFLVTLPAYALVIFCACVIPDVEIVINFVGSIGNSILNFIFPGIFYFIIMKNVEKKWKIYLALVFAIYGFVMGSFCTGVNVWTTIAPV